MTWGMVFPSIYFFFGIVSNPCLFFWPLSSPLVDFCLGFCPQHKWSPERGLLVAFPLLGAGTLTLAGSALPRLLQLYLVFERHPLASQPDATPTWVHPCSGPISSQSIPEHSELWPYSS